MATKPSDSPWFYEKRAFSKQNISPKQRIWLFIYVHIMLLAPDFQHQIRIYKWIISIRVTMATKTSYHQRFHKSGIFNEKGIFKETISFQHDRIWIILNVFEIIYICNTNTK